MSERSALRGHIFREGTHDSSSTVAWHYRWELLALLSCAFFFHQADRAIFGVVLPKIKSDLQLTDAQLGMVSSVLFFTLALLMLSWFSVKWKLGLAG